MAVASASTAAAPAVIDALLGDRNDPNPNHLLIVDVDDDSHRINQPPSQGTDSDPNLVHFVKNNIYVRDRSRSRSRDKGFSQQVVDLDASLE